MRKDILESSRKIKQKRFILRISLFGFLIAIIFAGIVSLFYIQKFRIKNIVIEGNSILRSEEIMANVFNSISGKYFYVLPKDNIFLSSKGDIENELLKNFPRIKFISSNKNLPNSFLIKIEERNPVALFCKEMECIFIDDNGFAFEKSPFYSGNVFIKFFDERQGGNENFSTQRQIISQNQFKEITSFIDSLKKMKIETTKVILKNENLYEVYSSEGWYILLGEEDDFNIALDNLKIVLEDQIKDQRQNLEYINLRLKNKVFYKFK